MPTLSNIRPKLKEGEHPLETGNYVIGTKAIDEAFEAIIKLIKTRTPGGIFVGRQRYGKTFAIRYLSSLLAEEASITPIVYNIMCKHHDRAISDNRFYEELLLSLRHSFTKSGSAAQKLERIVEYLFEQMSISKNLIILFDDAHRLNEHQYEWLVDIYNELDKLRIKPFFLFFGQPELAYRRNSFLEEGARQIIGRFMSRQYIFHGIQNASDIAICLESFDGENLGTDYPADSGWSYTRYFFKSAYDSGWRFSQLSELIWTVFSSLRKKYGLSLTFEIPMQDLCTTLEYIYLNYFDLYSVPPVINKSIIEQAIYNSGYIESELIFDLPPEKKVK